MGNDSHFDIRKELIETPAPLVSELIDPSALRRLLENRTGRHAAPHTLFALYMFNRWCGARPA